jgi:hypothetical protein
MLAIDSGCSGGTCPAVYDDDPELLPEELAIVGNGVAPRLRAKLADRIGMGEELIVIRREIVAEALRAPDEPVDLAALMTQFETFSYSAFRLETLQHYAGTGRDDQWVSLLKAGRRWGKAYQRVHVIAEPLTPAMQQELTEGYAPNVSAGEDIGIITTSPGAWPGPDIPEHDFWLFDSSTLLTMHYDPEGNWLGASRVRDPAAILAACRARDAALHRATSWHTYIADRPDLQRRVAQ